MLKHPSQIYFHPHSLWPKDHLHFLVHWLRIISVNSSPWYFSARSFHTPSYPLFFHHRNPLSGSPHCLLRKTWRFWNCINYPNLPLANQFLPLAGQGLLLFPYVSRVHTPHLPLNHFFSCPTPP